MENVARLELVAAYVRVSTQEQKLHGISLDAQRAKLKQYADEHNMHIVGWYEDEGVSGRKLIRKRPELQRMMSDAQKGLFTRILFVRLDRFFRSVAEYHEFVKKISPVIWTTTDEKYDLSTAQGRMLVNMKLTISEMEADMAGERVDLVNEYKVSTGQPLSGSMPFGFKIVIDPNNGRKKIIKDPEREAVVNDLLSFLFKHQSKRKAVAYLQETHNVDLRYKTISELTENTMLCGEYRGNQNYCEAYITRAEFDRLQEITKRNVKVNTVKRDYIFTGLLLCPNCGCRLAGGTQVHKVNGKEYRYKRYRCPNFRLHKRCDFRKSLSENVLERMMLDGVEKCLEDAKISNVKIKDAQTEQSHASRINEINARIDRLNYAWQTGKIRTVEKYEKDYAELMEELKKAEESQKKAAVKDFSKIEEILLSGWKAIYNELNDGYKRSFWRSFVQSIEISWTTERKEIAKINFF